MRGWWIVVAGAALAVGCAPEPGAGGGFVAPAVVNDGEVGSADVSSGSQADASAASCNNECCTKMNEFGRCTRTPEGKCVVGCDANCAGSTLRCLTSGMCTAHGNECVANSDADCKKGAGCKKAGKCVLGVLGSGCMSTEEADSFCNKQAACKNFSSCKGRDGNCINPADPADCKHSYACKAEGRCTWTGTRCMATSLADCAGLWCGAACEIKYGKCVLQQTDGGCQTHEYCKSHGRCHWVDGKCVPLSDADCQQSTQCTKHGSNCKYLQMTVAGIVERYCCDANGNGCQ